MIVGTDFRLGGKVMLLDEDRRFIKWSTVTHMMYVDGERVILVADAPEGEFIAVGVESEAE